jgi:hypothetical protein
MRTMRFNTECTVQECLKQIAEKMGASVDGCGLWSNEPRRGFLHSGKSLQYYDIKTGACATRDAHYLTFLSQDSLHVRKLHAPLRIITIDGCTKTLMIPQDKPVSELLVIIGEKLDIAHPEEYDLHSLHLRCSHLLPLANCELILILSDTACKCSTMQRRSPSTARRASGNITFMMATLWFSMYHDVSTFPRMCLCVCTVSL